MNVVALISATFLISAVTAAPTVTRIWGFGMMNESETTPSKDNSPEALFAQNQANCLKPLADDWWSPIAGPFTVKVCVPPVPPVNSEPTPKTQTATESQNQATLTGQSSSESNGETQGNPTTPPVVTETKDKEGNSVITSTTKDLTVTAIVTAKSIQEVVGTPEVAQQVLEQDKKDKKDYDNGLAAGVTASFKFARNLAQGKYVGSMTQEEFMQLTPEKQHKMIAGAIATVAKGRSDAYKLGLLRGMGLSSDFINIFGVSGFSLPFEKPD